MQVEQHVVPREERAEAVGDVVLEIDRRVAREEVAIEVAVAGALALCVGEAGS
jgi:hypothetical protein